MGKNLYQDGSIEHLSPLEFTRLRPGVYAGDCTYATQLLVEVFANAVDEYNIGHGDTIEVKIKDKIVTVKDSGQGFLVNSMVGDETVLQAAFDLINTSGKYREDGTYEGSSLGSFGVGAKIANYLSHYLKAKTQRDGQWEEVTFKEGVFEKRKTGTVASAATGTTVEFEPSEQFFTNPTIEISKIENIFSTIAGLCPGLTIKFDNNGTKTTYKSKKGIEDLIDREVNGNEILKKRLVINEKVENQKLNLAMTFTTDYSAKYISYVNTGLVDAGSHLTQLKTIITRELNNFYRDNNWLKAKDENFSGTEIQEGLVCVFNMTLPNVSYDSQVKTRVTNIDLSKLMPIFTEKFKEWLITNKTQVKKLADKALTARKAAAAAKKARDAAREAGLDKPTTKTKAVDLPSKISDCWSKNRSECELFITEGDSAAGGVKIAKNNEFQALIPVRGKILNCEKATVDKIMKNAEIVDMIKAFGLEPDKEDPTKLVYDAKKLRYGKIIISADADVDGGHIQMLFYTFIWNFCPQLFTEGKVYATVPPLYRITEGKDNYIYLQDDQALEEYKKANPNKKYIVSRHKGLGEQDPDELRLTLLDPNTRVLKQITVEDAERAEKMFNDLMGSSAEPRKEYLKIHSNEAQGGV